MAFGFLGQDVGGYAQGPMPSGDAGVPRSGVTYGDILSAALQYGSKPGSSGPQFGGLIQQPYGGNALAAKQNRFLNDPNKQEKSSLSEALNAIWSIFMGGV